MGTRRLWITHLFQVQPGDIYGFIGANGAEAKRQTIKAVVGIHDFEDGSIIINGHSIKEEPVICKKWWRISQIIQICMNIWQDFNILIFIADLFEIPTKNTQRREYKNTVIYLIWLIIFRGLFLHIHMEWSNEQPLFLHLYILPNCWF